MTSPTTIVLVEDDERLSDLIGRFLEGHGFKLQILRSGQNAADKICHAMPDLVILDLGLPDEDGLTICKALRPRYANPILILTARDTEVDHILGLELGADDYVIKPVEPRVLMARVNALLRRSRPSSNRDNRDLKFGALRISSASRSVVLNEHPVELSSHEFDLLYALASRAGEVQSREALFQQLYRREYDGTERILDIRISHLRKKLAGMEGSAERIKTVWGQGYLFVPDAW
jgi:two-component system OmpR family response regulator/two-component system response regulator RstA